MTAEEDHSLFAIIIRFRFSFIFYVENLSKKKSILCKNSMKYNIETPCCLNTLSSSSPAKMCSSRTLLYDISNRQVKRDKKSKY